MSRKDMASGICLLAACVSFIDQLLSAVCFVALLDDSTGKLYLKLVHYQGAYCLTTDGGVLHLTPECSTDETQQFHFSSISSSNDANDLRSVHCCRPAPPSPCLGSGCPSLPALLRYCLPA